MKMNWFKTPKGLAAAATVTATITLVIICIWNIKTSFNAVHTRQQITKKAEVNRNLKFANHTRTHEAPFIHPPIHGVDVPFKSYSVDAGKGATLSYKGSKVIIPAGIFCDNKGKDITGKVNIKYREFHNPIDFFVSGIPMTYDSAGKQYTFESAGMVDIRGEKDGVPIMIKPGKSLKVEMESTQKGKYNLYSLDTVKKNWVFQGVNSTPVANTTAKVDKATVSLANNNDESSITKPVKPRKADRRKTSFLLNIDATDFPEFSVYTNTLFEVDKKNKGFKKDYAKVTWNDVSLKRIENSDNYMITLIKDKESHSFTVYPVVDADNYKAALAEYNKKYAEYLYSKATVTSYSGVRYFVANGFGIWNCDCPTRAPEGAALAATFLYDNTDTLSNTTIFLVETDKNALYKTYAGTTFKFNPNSTNLAWCITPDNKVALFTPESFKSIKTFSGKYTFNMRVVDKEIKSEDDLAIVFNEYL